jgi:hypothetical protein
MSYSKNTTVRSVHRSTRGTGLYNKIEPLNNMNIASHGHDNPILAYWASLCQLGSVQCPHSSSEVVKWYGSALGSAVPIL